ncbi:hypothetical protein DB30_01167 [Enhygromyxa salina]|uniref:Uncharacterized protein n=1 Tax=Enhygromyxa salina TaxID=215803 RepID=A0A0C1Z4V6_9BACT|nr:hypothetical protein DB30_01167 [Enhygromyxa salina]
MVLIGCSKQPCGGKGMVIDERPLDGTLGQVIGPAGGVMCRPAQDDGQYQATHRRYELTDMTPDQADAAWAKHMQSNGWQDVTPLPLLAANADNAVRDEEECGIVEQWYAKPGEPTRVQVTVSYCVDKGWSSVTVFACDDDIPRAECRDTPGIDP